MGKAIATLIQGGELITRSLCPIEEFITGRGSGYPASRADLVKFARVSRQ